MTTRKPKEEIDEFTDMDLDQLQQYIATNTPLLLQAKEKRNYVQQEREMINSYYDISRQEFQKLEKEIEKVAYVMELMEDKQKETINAFLNKFRHLEYDHEIFITDILPRNATNAEKKEEEIRVEREAFYLSKKSDLKKKIREEAGINREEIKEAKDRLEKKYDKTKDELERRLNDIVLRYKNDMKQLEEDLELRLKVEIHELEERKNLHINNLIRAFEDRMDAWKKENIEQIKENINLIKTNTDNLKSLKAENDHLEKEVDELKKEIATLEKQLEAAKLEHSQVTNRLAKYYNQEINIENMNAKVLSLQKRCQETIKKTEELEKQKQRFSLQIADLKKEFVDAVKQFRSRAEYKNDILEEHINQLNETYTKREIEIEELLKEVDNVMEGDMMDGDDHMEGSNRGGFNREMFVDMLEHIRVVLSTKTQIIKNLKYSLALATKVIIDGGNQY